MKTPFTDARLKVKRAGEHIQDFHGQILQFHHGHSINVHNKTNTGCDALEFVPCPAIPKEIMCIVGDAVHNLRSALDVAMSEIEFLTTGERTDDVIFPVYKRRAHLERAVERRLKGKTPKRVIDYIVESIQPYEGGVVMPSGDFTVSTLRTNIGSSSPICSLSGFAISAT
jgi:hypothetical protein